MTMPGQLEDVLRLSEELEDHQAQREKCLAKPSTDPGKAESFDKLIAEDKDAIERARAAVPPEALEHIDELLAARARYNKATAKIVAQFPQPGGVPEAGAEGGAHDATVKVK